MNLKKELKHKEYLDKTFLEELNYKIWSTKGSRFIANKRLILQGKLSNLANSMLSVYLIAISLLSVYNIYREGFIAQNVLPYITTCISILLLVFNQIENSKNYQQKAKEFHNCGLELSKLYNELRIFKTFNPTSSLKEQEIFAKEISFRYENILEKYDNHIPIDYSIFQMENPQYIELNWVKITKIKIEYYFKTQFWFQLLIVFPPFCLILMSSKYIIKLI